MRNFLVAAGILFFFSGASGLIYQVVWTKILALQFGSSAWSISTVVSAFMAGLGIGSFWAGRKVQKWKRPFWIYGILEIAIALFGLVSLPLFHHLDLLIAPLYHALENHLWLFVLLRFIISFLILIIPTFLMGASLPVLAVGIARIGSLQKTIGTLYGINTLGAAFGVLSSGFFILPWLGALWTIGIGVAIGLGVGILALVWDRVWCQSDIKIEEEPPTPKKPSFTLLAIVFISGAVGLFCEISWTRLLSPVLGSSTYAFSVILATFLIGIGIGGLLAAKKWHENYRLTISLLLFFVAFGIVLSVFFINILPQLFVKLLSLTKGNIWLLFLSQGMLAGALIFIPTCALGVILPLAILAHQQESGSTGKAVGEIYATNTIGAIFGSLAAGFFALPYLGVNFSLILMAILSAAMAILLAFNQISIPKRILCSISGVAILAVVFILQPKINISQLHSGVFRFQGVKKLFPIPEDLLFVKDGLTATITVYRDPHSTWYKANGKSEASTLADLPTQYLVGHLPLFLNLKSKKACVIGLGSGATANAMLAHPLEKLDIVELEPAVVNAYSYFPMIHNHVLKNPKAHLHIEDGRNFIRYSRTLYDVIVSEPSNPWVAGISTLFTTEYYQMARQKLTKSGIFCQWIQAYEISTPTLNVMLSTLGDVFPYVYLFEVNSDFICIASNNPIKVNAKECRERLQYPHVKKTLQRIDIGNIYELFGYYVAHFPEDKKSFSSPLRNNDDNLWLEYRAPIEMYSRKSPKNTNIDTKNFLSKIHKIFFFENTKENTAIHLARAITKLRPQYFFFIDMWQKQFNQKSIFEQLSKKSKETFLLKKRLPGLYDEAKKLFYRGNISVAIQLLQKIVTIDTKSSKGYRLLGDIYFSTKQPHKALTVYKKALEVNSYDYLAHGKIAVLLFSQDKIQAEKHLQQAIAINPYHIEGYATWIHLLRKSNQNNKAQKIQKQAQKTLSRKKWQQLKDLLLLME